MSGCCVEPHLFVNPMFDLQIVRHIICGIKVILEVNTVKLKTRG